MNKVHDMGGRLGDGAIPDKGDNIVFHTEWEARALATTLAIGSLGLWNIDASRHSRERLTDQEYSNFGYYEKWLAAATNMLVENKALSLGDLDRAKDIALGRAEAKPAAELSEKTLTAANVSRVIGSGSPYTRADGPKALYNLGDLVQTLSHSPNPSGHTRLPAYAMGKTGRIVLMHGNHVLPDSNAHKNGEAPEPLYAVEFSAKMLWPDTVKDERDSVTLDLWQNYLRPA